MVRQVQTDRSVIGANVYSSLIDYFQMDYVSFHKSTPNVFYVLDCGLGHIFLSNHLGTLEKSNSARIKPISFSVFCVLIWPEPNAINLRCTKFVLPCPWHT